MNTDIPQEILNYFSKCARKAAEAGLLSCSSGNLSLRLPELSGDSGLALLSATGSWLEELREDQIALCRISDGQCLNGVRPTMEAGFHLGVLRRRPEIGCVLHFQSPYATVVACMKDKPKDFNVTLEEPLYVGREVPVVPFLPPGSRSAVPPARLGRTRRSGSRGPCRPRHRPDVQPRTDGQAACGKDFPETFRRAVFFEMACRIIVLSRGNYTVI